MQPPDYSGKTNPIAIGGQPEAEQGGYGWGRGVLDAALLGGGLALPMAGGGMWAARALGTGGPKALQFLLNAYRAAPATVIGSEVAGGAAGSVASHLAQEGGGGTAAQLGAGLAGGIAGGVGSSLLIQMRQEAVQQSLRSAVSAAAVKNGIKGDTAEAVAIDGHPATAWQQSRVLDAIEDAPRVGAAKAGNVNLEAMDEGEAAYRRMTQEILEQHGGPKAFWEARRGKRSWDETIKAAEDDIATKAGMHPDEITKARARNPGEAYNAEQLAGTQIRLMAAEEEIGLARQAMLEGTDGAHGRFAAAITREAQVLEEFSGASAEAGRALNILRKGARGKQRAKARELLVKAYGGEENLEALATAMGKLDETGAAALARYAKISADQGLGWKAANIWKALLLSSPSTHATNILSNGVFPAMFQAENVAAVAIGQGRKAFVNAAGRVAPALRETGYYQRSQETVGFHEAMSELYGVATSIPDSLRSMRNSWRTGSEWQSPSGVKGARPDEREGAESILRDLGVPPIRDKGSNLLHTAADKVQDVTDYAFRALTAEDAFFKEMAFNGRMRSLAMRDAIQNGVEPKLRGAHIAQWLKNAPAGAIDEAVGHADNMTFQRGLGDIGKGVQQLSRKHWSMQIPLPFVRTPINVSKEGIYRTPGLNMLAPSLLRDIKAGGVASDRAMAKWVSGLAIGVPIWQMVDSGKITGAVPSNAIEREQFYSERKLPYSWRDTEDSEWEQYVRLEPLATPMAMVATFKDAVNRGVIGTDEAIPMAVSAVTEHIFNKASLRGVSQVTGALDDPERNLDRYIQTLAGSLIPSVVARAANSLDPYQRDQYAKGLTGSAAAGVKARIPGLREDLPMRYDLVGRPVPRGDSESSVASRFLDPTMNRPIDDDPVAFAIGDSGARVKPINRRIQVTQDEALIAAGQHDPELRDAILSSEKQLMLRLDPHLRADLIRDSHSSAAERVRGILPALESMNSDFAQETPVEAFAERLPDDAQRALRIRGIKRARGIEATREIIEEFYRFEKESRIQGLIDAMAKDGSLREQVLEQVGKQSSKARYRRNQRAR